MPATTKADVQAAALAVQTAITAVTTQLNKGLGIAPRPDSDNLSANVALASAKALLATASTAAAAAKTAADSLP